MSDFIKWCNDNQGFLSAILTFMSILLSVIAVCVSVIVAKLPFKKKIAVASFTNFGIGINEHVQFFSVEATNIGNRVIKVKYVGIAYKIGGKWKNTFNSQCPNPTNVMLDINETVDAKYDMNQLYSMNENHSLYAVAVDIEGKVYKRRIKFL